MVFKNKLFFSSKKSDSSSPDGSNSPRSIGSNSPIRSDKKKPKSNSKEESQISTTTSTSSFSGVARKHTQVKDAGKKKEAVSKGKDVAEPLLPSKPKFCASQVKKPAATESKEGPASVSPILASSLGLNRIKTRSGPLPQESFFSFRGEKGPAAVLGASNLSRLGAGDGGSGSASGSAKSVSGSSGRKKEGGNNKTGFQGNAGSVAWADNGSNADTMSTGSWLSREQSPNVQAGSRLQNGESSTEAGTSFTGAVTFKILKINSAKKSYSQEQRGLDWKLDHVVPPGSLVSSADDASKDLDSPASRVRMSSWKKLPSASGKSPKEVDSPKEQDDVKVEPSKISSRKRIPDVDMAPAKPPEFPPAKESQEHSSKHQHKVSWGYWGDQQNISEESSIICRICEEEVPTSHVEDHSRICAIADRCDQKGLSVNERLTRISETLEKMIESFSQKDIQHGIGSPDVAKVSNSSVTEDSDVLSPKLSDWSRRGSEDMLDCFPEADNSTFMDDLKSLPAMSCKTRFGQKSDQGMTTSSAGSMTPRSPILTPRTCQIDLLLAGKSAYSEHDDLPQCREMYLQLCELVDDEKLDISSTVIDEDAPLEDDVVRSLRASPIHSSKDRTSIDDFEIIKPISRGAFGRVFLAKKRTTGDLFAIKVLKKADMIRKNAVESILAERDILISVRNPFVVRFFYSFTCRENLYLVMEYLNGGDLYSLLRNLGCLDEDVARVYIAEVVLALEYLHSLRVVHRDLKPDNLLIAHDGHIKLTDFGLSKVGLINSTDDLSGPAVSGTSLLEDDEPQLSASEHQRERRKKRSAVGTPDYLAPEILLGTGHGATADWWSVGIILFELIVGIPPFNAEHPQQIFDNILNRNIPWPRVPEEMSPEAQDLIDRLLTEDPQLRLGYRGASEVKQHVFFKDINWDTLARQKAAFVPASESALDTSYFTSRYSWNASDNHAYPVSEEDSSDADSLSGSSCLSNRQDEVGDECGGLAEFESGSSVNY
ncbi:probable serine/threonine protein kinase IREH1, partial [Carica papaya]|uniref:probable serine/threonine protein kinase IREH1 n=1 Tax=Carica papaya TaxID=3649 RepID=UPI000B8C75B1